MEGVLRSQQVAINDVHYCVGLLWDHLPNRMAIAQKCRLLKLTYGVHYPKEQLLGLSGGEVQGLMPLASVVAKRFENGIFISDNLVQPQEGESRQIWICAFQDGIPVAQLTAQNTEGVSYTITSDSLVFSERAHGILRDLSMLKDQTIYVDIQYESQLLPKRAKNVEPINLFQAIDDKRLRVPRVKRVYNPRKYVGPIVAIVIIIILLSILSHFFFKKSPVAKSTIKNEAKTALLRKDDFLKNLHQRLTNENGVYVMTTLKEAMQFIPLSPGGWQLTSLSYNVAAPRVVRATYIAQKLTHAAGFDAYFKQFPFSQALSASVSVAPSLKAASVTYTLRQLPPQSYKQTLGALFKTGYSTLQLDRFTQHYQVPHVLGEFLPLGYGYSKTELRFDGLNAMGFDTVMLLMSQTPLLTISTIDGSVDPTKGIDWDIGGNLYAKN